MTANSLYDAIAAGDTVGIDDPSHNYIEGPVALSGAGATMSVRAFGTTIAFARRNSAGTWIGVAGIHIRCHQPPLEFE